MTRIALVTGGNSGIGFEVVRALAERGMCVYLGSRDLAKGQAAAAQLASAGEVRAVRIDMADETSFASTLDIIKREHDHLDVLVNNAGVSLSGSAQDIDSETVRLTFETNLHGPMRLTQLAAPLLRRSTAGRVVNVSSRAGQFAFMRGSDPRFDAARLPYAYCVSKAAMNAATVLWAANLKADGVKVNACNPGYVNTQVSRFQGTKTPAEGARIVIDLATAPDDGPTGGFFEENGPLDW